MIIDRLILHNFGIYKGRHEITLTPDHKKPIILFGGLNGGGKTTFLDAILLALYGKFADCSGRGNLGYEQFLADCINRDVPSTDGASVTLDFRQWNSGESEKFSITRFWRDTGRSIQESVDVYRNGIPDPEASDRWYELVEELLPAQIAKLFFFDGEKIEDLASQDKSASLISTGLKTLLGLDLVSTLEADLTILRRRMAGSAGTSAEEESLNRLEDVVSQAEAQRARLTGKRAALRTEHRQLVLQEDRLRDQYRQLGGELYEQRESLQAEHEIQSRALAHVEDRLREMAAGVAPLLMLATQLKAAKQDSITDREAADARTLVELLLDRDNRTLAFMSQDTDSASTLESISDYLAKDRQRLARQAKEYSGLDIDPSCFVTVDSASLDDTGNRIGILLREHLALQESIVRTERKLAGIPDPEGLTGISNKLISNQEARLKTDQALEVLTEEIAHAQAEIDQAQNKLNQAQEKALKAAFTEEKVQRSLHSIDQVDSVLRSFRQHLVAQHTRALADLIFDSYRALLRKDELISKVTIDPATCRLTLFTHEGERLSPARLSAGERQLLVVSVLWGLMKASGRPLPTVIDTPLGRLDSDHRTNLVENYFPAASHQVILLSTDKEIDEEYYQQLLPFITHDYRLYYDEKSRSSRIVEGYFWKGAA